MKELIARINNQLNIIQLSAKQGTEESAPIALGNYLFLPDRYELILKKQVRKLSLREAEVLTMLAANRNQSTDRKSMLMRIWGDDSYYNSRTLDVYVRKLRSYLSEDPRIEIITLKGKGYQFVVPG